MDISDCSPNISMSLRTHIASHTHLCFKPIVLSFLHSVPVPALFPRLDRQGLVPSFICCILWKNRGKWLQKDGETPRPANRVLRGHRSDNGDWSRHGEKNKLGETSGRKSTHSEVQRRPAVCYQKIEFRKRWGISTFPDEKNTVCVCVNSGLTHKHFLLLVAWEWIIHKILNDL